LRNCKPCGQNSRYKELVDQRHWLLNEVYAVAAADHYHRFTGHFPGEPGLAGCHFDFPSPLVPTLSLQSDGISRSFQAVCGRRSIGKYSNYCHYKLLISCCWRLCELYQQHRQRVQELVTDARQLDPSLPEYSW